MWSQLGNQSSNRKIIAYEVVELLRNNVSYEELIFQIVGVVKLHLLQKGLVLKVSQLFVPPRGRVLRTVGAYAHHCRSCVDPCTCQAADLSTPDPWTPGSLLSGRSANFGISISRLIKLTLIDLQPAYSQRRHRLLQSTRRS